MLLQVHVLLQVHLLLHLQLLVHILLLLLVEGGQEITDLRTGPQTVVKVGVAEHMVGLLLCLLHQAVRLSDQVQGAVVLTQVARGASAVATSSLYRRKPHIRANAHRH